MEDSSGRTTPKAEPVTSPRSPSTDSDVSDATKEREEQYDRWLENMRVIESLREYVRGRLDRKEFEEAERSTDANRRKDSDAMDVDMKSPPVQPIGLREGGSNLYPRLPVPGS